MADRMRRRRRALAVLVTAVGLLGATACGDSGQSTTTGPTTTGTGTSTSTTAATTTTAPTLLGRNWTDTAWTPGSGPAAGAVVVDGRPSGLTSVTALCQADCRFGLDLLTDSPTGAAPAPGPYLVWSSRLTGRNPDGTPNWRVVAQQPVVLAEGQSPTVCTRVGDPVSTALGLIAAVPAGAAAVAPLRVWTSGPDGALTQADPAGFTCELGQD